jgi:hypothetical protein
VSRYPMCSSLIWQGSRNWKFEFLSRQLVPARARQRKRRGYVRAFLQSAPHQAPGSIVAACGAEQVEQARKQIVDAYVQRHGCRDVVRLTTVDDLACLVKNQTRH